jgi:hypothetical protein
MQLYTRSVHYCFQRLIKCYWRGPPTWFVRVCISIYILLKIIHSFKALCLLIKLALIYTDCCHPLLCIVLLMSRSASYYQDTLFWAFKKTWCHLLSHFMTPCLFGFPSRLFERFIVYATGTN